MLSLLCLLRMLFHVDTNRSSFLIATLEICGTSSSRPHQKSVRGRFIYVTFNLVSDEIFITSSIVLPVEAYPTHFVTTEHHLPLLEKRCFTVPCRFHKCFIMSERTSSLIRVSSLVTKSLYTGKESMTVSQHMASKTLSS
jgi:hypothetical protein